MKKVAILTSGGDAPGMNATLRAFTRYAISNKLEVVGIERGYEGLINGNLIPLARRSVSDILQRGGTILKTARSVEFTTFTGRQKAYKVLKDNDIDGLCVIGGDGTFLGAQLLSQEFGFPVVGIPGTIDNDLAYTDFSIGFDTAVNTALDAINKIRDTMTSHDRTCIVQTMGRNCGDIALYAGIGGGAEAILVPEIEYDINRIADNVIANHRKGKSSDIIVVAEGAGKAEELAIVLKALTKVSMRTVVLGYIQRGGSPTLQDRLLGAQFGVTAVKVLLDGESKVVGIKNNRIITLDITTALRKTKKFEKKLYNIANTLAE
ncbi:MAG: 6-phosphofructokinase [Clostridia bacterium]|nr:6-phosphofructokinase [Clostridia bacterium]